MIAPSRRSGTLKRRPTAAPIRSAAPPTKPQKAASATAGKLLGRRGWVVGRRHRQVVRVDRVQLGSLEALVAQVRDLRVLLREDHLQEGAVRGVLDQDDEIPVAAANQGRAG